jgi:hypothetical protein
MFFDFIFPHIICILYCNLGFTSETIIQPISPSRTDIKQTEHMVTFSDTRDTGPPQGMGQSKHSGVWDIVKGLNDERIKVDHELRDGEQAEIKSLLKQQVKHIFDCIFLSKNT